MEYWTIINARGEFINACSSTKGLKLRAHHGPRLFQTECDSITEALSKHVKDSVFHPHQIEKSKNKPGVFYPRICREKIDSNLQELPDFRTIYKKESSSAFQSARNLFVQIREIFRYIEPTVNNQYVYGEQLRSLLILACTEVESSLRAILIANNGATSIDRLTTKDYVRLLEPMKLNEWSVRLSSFSEFGSISPFRNWKVNAPTASIQWYDDYNKVKHNREENLKFATLSNVVSAMSAIYIMLAAQFGVRNLHGIDPISSELIFEKMPEWKLSEFYIPELVDGGCGNWISQPLF